MSTTARKPASAGRRVMKAAQVVVGLGLAIALVVWGIPLIGNTSWSSIFSSISRISLWHLVVFFVLLMASLWCYTFLITGSLPGISHSRALTVNLAATAVSNVLPAGGVMGIAATYMMCRSWDLPKRETSNSLIIAGVWNVLVRLAMPVVALLLLLTTDNQGLPNYVIQLTTILVVAGLGVIGLFIAAIISERAAALVGRLADRSVGRIQQRRGKATAPFEPRLKEWQRHMSGVVGLKWFEMTAGLSGFFFFLFILFWECMGAVGVELSWQRMFVAYAMGRLVTAFPVTPGSMGVAEIGALGMFRAFGAGGTDTTAGIALFMIASTMAQIPLGGVAWGVWHFGPRRRGSDAAADEPETGLLKNPQGTATEVFRAVEGQVHAEGDAPGTRRSEAGNRTVPIVARGATAVRRGGGSGGATPEGSGLAGESDTDGAPGAHPEP